jgi:hypothetical protein
VNRLALYALLLATPALAQDTEQETVTVHGSSLVGVWHGTLGQSAFRGLFGNLTGMTPMKLGQAVVLHCRIASTGGEMEMSCPQFGYMGRVTDSDGLVRIGGRRMVFEGEQPDANSLRGRFRSRSWLGLSQHNPVVAEAVRVVPQAGAPDRSGKAALLSLILEQGLAAAPHDEEAMKSNGSKFNLPKVGEVQGISYLGQETKWDWPPPPGTKADILNLPSRPDFFSIYLVRFADGELLCGLHQRADGVLDAIGCV